MTDLRDRIPEFELAALRLLGATASICHPSRRAWSRHLCRSCYEVALKKGEHIDYPPMRTIRKRDDFVEDYRLLRSEGYNRQQIADRLGMTYTAVTNAYLRAVAAGSLAPDRGFRHRNRVSRGQMAAA